MAKGDNGGFMTGLVVGGLVGAALALLYTPRSGRENREKLLERAVDLGGQSPEALVEGGRAVLRERFRQATTEAQLAAKGTEARLQDEYRASRDGG